MRVGWGGGGAAPDSRLTERGRRSHEALCGYWRGWWCAPGGRLKYPEYLQISFRETLSRLLHWINLAFLNIKRYLKKGMSCASWQWHKTGSRWFPVRTLMVAPLWCDLGFFPNSRGNKAAVILCPIIIKFQIKFTSKTYHKKIFSFNIWYI